MAIYVISTPSPHAARDTPVKNLFAGISAVDHFSQPDVAENDDGDCGVFGQGHGAILFNPSVTLIADADTYAIVLLAAPAVTPTSLADQ